MSDEAESSKTLLKIMNECRPHLTAIHRIFKGHAEITMVAKLPRMPGAVLLSAASQEITPDMIIRWMQELNDQAVGAPITAYGGRISEEPN